MWLYVGYMVSHDRNVALVTGANRGIGREVARQLAGRGLTVVIGSRDLSAGQVVADELAASGGSVTAVRLDVVEQGSPASAIDEIVLRFGRLDVLVNNAGRFIEVDAADTTGDDLRAVFETNLFGAAETIRAAIPRLRRSAGARIVNVSSTTGSLTLAAGGADLGGDASLRLAYATSKTALNMLTVQYHRAFQEDPTLRHIKINAGTPGYTATDMNGGRGTRSVEEGARVIVELASLPDDGPSGGFYNDQGPVAW
jgi:NAD(P)-dependent dehydrogenase (short-subunit alcohol dehydrogenase family)